MDSNNELRLGRRKELVALSVSMQMKVNAKTRRDGTEFGNTAVTFIRQASYRRGGLKQYLKPARDLSYAVLYVPSPLVDPPVLSESHKVNSYES